MFSKIYIYSFSDDWNIPGICYYHFPIWCVKSHFWKFILETSLQLLMMFMILDFLHLAL